MASEAAEQTSFGPGPVPRGQVSTIMRRMTALQKAIDDGSSWEQLEWHYDQVHRALTKAFGLPR